MPVVADRFLYIPQLGEVYDAFFIRMRPLLTL